MSSASAACGIVTAAAARRGLCQVTCSAFSFSTLLFSAGMACPSKPPAQMNGFTRVDEKSLLFTGRTPYCGKIFSSLEGVPVAEELMHRTWSGVQQWLGSIIYVAKQP